MPEQTTGQRFARLTRSALSDGTYDAIRTMLLTHEIAPGERVVIDTLAHGMAVSQTPVREALARLESDGLVVKQTLKGDAATPLLTLTQVDDLFQFRLVVEPWSAERAAELADPAGLAALDEELRRGGEAGSATQPIDQAYEAMSAHDARFHELISEMSGSPLITEALARTHCHMHLYRLYQAGQAQIADAGSNSSAVKEIFGLYYEPTNGFLAYQQHQAIAEAIAAGDGDAARERMREHLQSSRERFANILSALQR